ncbi:hypothetical protein BC829DRAFT_233758 [Chytridium lagenaria]|nr:hypothetical protein BC829DRAFT_233758 [Chytridium lagenaria]
MKPLDVDLPILAPIDSNNSSLNLMDADVDVPNGKRETIAEIDADVDEEAMSLAEDLVNASDANVGHEGGVDFAETEGDLEADAGLMATTNVPKDRSETTAEMAVDAGKDVMSLAEGLVNASDANVGHEGGVDFAETEGAVEADAGLMATTNVPVYLVEGGDDFTPLGQRVNEPTPATSPASNVGITEPVKNEAVTIEEQSEDIGHMIMLAERYALHGRSRRGNGCRGSRNARQPPSQEELRRIALVTRFKK